MVEIRGGRSGNLVPWLGPSGIHKVKSFSQWEPGMMYGHHIGIINMEFVSPNYFYVG